MYQILKSAEGEIIEKKSRFIGNIFLVHSPNQALDIVADIKKKHYDARHHCFAYVIEDEISERFSDDGEPSGTAGKPILEVINGNKLTNTLIVVTRYFGGTLLGTGGLTRAYRDAAKAAIDEATLIERIRGIKGRAVVNYDLYGRFEKMLSAQSSYVYNVKFTENVTIDFIAPEDKIGQIEHNIVQMSNGQVALEEKNQTIYTVVDGKAIVL